MARQFREQLESEVNLEELNRMTEARAKEARPRRHRRIRRRHRSSVANRWTSPPPTHQRHRRATPVTRSTPPLTSPEAMAQSEPAEPEYVVPPPGDASHNDLSEPPEHPQDSPHGRSG